MDLGTSKLNPSSFIALKAELHKKYENVRKAKLDQNEPSSKPSPFKSKTDPPREKKKIPVIASKPQEDDEEELALKKSRLALEAKSKIYEKIVSSDVLLDDEENDSYLVDFQRKVLYSSTESVKPYNVETDKYWGDIYTVTHQSNTNKNEILDTTPVPSVDRPNEKDPTDEATHYQNVQFNEVRDHGTGYFAFSTDEAKRKEQMEELKLLRQKTEEQRVSKQKLMKKRQTMLQNRLARICERKNIDQSVLENFNTDTESENKDAKVSDLSSIPLPEEESSVKKKTKIRPWDIGKDGLQHFVPEKKKTKSQNDWVNEKREERVTEFAPPSQYLYQ